MQLSPKSSKKSLSRETRAREIEIEPSHLAAHSARLDVDSERENLGLRKIAANSSEGPYAVLQGLLTAALDLCGGGAHTSTAGVSLLETTACGEEQFRWVALAGCLAAHVGGTSPRSFSPCGVCLDRNAPVLFARPDLTYDYFQSAGIEFTEGLVVPFGNSFQANPIGTIWVISHPPARHHFDAQDVALLKSLGSFAASAFSLATASECADVSRRQAQDIVVEMSQEMRTQLSTIAGFVDLLGLGIKGNLSDGQAEYVERIRNATSLLLAEVNGLSHSAQSTNWNLSGPTDGFESVVQRELRLS